MEYAAALLLTAPGPIPTTNAAESRGTEGGRRLKWGEAAGSYDPNAEEDEEDDETAE
jgi:hypothetical protein